jgi:uncharacterized protein
LVSVFFILKLRVHYHFEHFFPKDDPDYVTYTSFRRQFPVDDRMLIVAVQASNGIFNSSFLEDVSHLEKELENIDHIEDVSSLASLSVPVKTPLGFIQNPVISRNPDKLAEDSLRIMGSPAISKYYLSDDLQHYALYISLADSTSDTENRQIIQSIKEKVNGYGFEPSYMAGFLYTQVSYIKLLEQEIPFTSAYVAAALCLILMILYRSWANMVLLTGIVLLGLVLFFGYLGMMGRTLNITSTLFITIMIIVGVSDIIHLQTYYHKYLLKNVDRLNAIQLAFKEVKLNLLLTSITTAAGFLTFLSSSIPHISSFGFDAAVGVLIAFLVAVTLAPVLFYHFPPGEAFLKRNMEGKRWERFLFAVYKKGKSNTTWILVISAFVMVGSLISLQWMETNQTLSGNFSEKHTIKQDIDFFEKQFGGIRGFELWMQPKGGFSVSDPNVLKAIEKIEEYLEQSGHFGPVFSPYAWLRMSHLMNTGFRNIQADLPLETEYIQYLLDADINKRKAHFINEETQSARLVTKMKDVGMAEAAGIHDSLFAFIKSRGIDLTLDVRITGSAVLIDNNNQNVNTEMFYSLGIAFAFISLLMGLLFRNIKMVLISILPNVVPLLAVGGVMALGKIPLSAATSLIFTIGFVIAIDDTIHFLTRFRDEFSGTGNLEMAIKNTLTYTGRAIIYTSIILFAGYGILVLSSFKEIMHHAVLVCATLFFALVADLFLLPTLIRIAIRKVR